MAATAYQSLLYGIGCESALIFTAITVKINGYFSVAVFFNQLIGADIDIRLH